VSAAPACAVLAVAWLLAGSALAADVGTARQLEQARAAAAEILQKTGTELTREMEASGPQRSVVLCKYSAPEITTSISRRTGFRVTRVSLRPRNPVLGAADAWEQKALLDFEARVGRGEKADAMEFFEVVSEPQGRFLRYLRAIPMGANCLACHGPSESISPAVLSVIHSEYPFDRAGGYRVGQVRGAVTVKVPL